MPEYEKRTRRDLSAALRALLREEPLDQLRVRELTERFDRLPNVLKRARRDALDQAGIPYDQRKRRISMIKFIASDLDGTLLKHGVQYPSREALELILNGELSLEDTALEETRVARSFEEAGVLSGDDGLVLRMQDGSEFQITIRQSR